MAERAAQLVDHVLPDVPVRQYVLSLPYRVRYLLACRHDRCRAVVRALMRAVERRLRAWGSPGAGSTSRETTELLTT